MQTIQVSDVAVATKPLKEVKSLEAWNILTRNKIESCSEPYSKFIPCQYHPLVAASHMAYDEHRPLVLSPDMIWLMIAQGISSHVNANAEELRSKFVNFNGKLLIEIQRDDFKKGSSDNDWSGAFSEFSTKVKDSMHPGIYDKLVTSFSTSGPIEKAANEIVLLEAVKSYFEYAMKTMCGIPTIIQEGTKEDWGLLAKKTEDLANSFNLNWWLRELVPIVSKMASSAAGKDEKKFWEVWYKLSGGSGGPYICGHISKFFPYLKDYRTKESSRKVEHFEHCYITDDDLPSGVSSAPFLWKYYENSFKMSLKAGFVGCTQDKDTMAVRPKIGWAVVEEDKGLDKQYQRTCKECGHTGMYEEFRFSNKKEYKNPGTLCDDCFFDISEKEKNKILNG
jgi:Domain of unknown function (DUF4419)